MVPAPSYGNKVLFSGLAAGSSTYNVSDANGCTAYCSVTITEPAALVAACSVVSNVAVTVDRMGSASVSASGVGYCSLYGNWIRSAGLGAVGEWSASAPLSVS